MGLAGPYYLAQNTVKLFLYFYGVSSYVAASHWCFRLSPAPRSCKGGKANCGGKRLADLFMVRKLFSIVSSDGVNNVFERLERGYRG